MVGFIIWYAVNGKLSPKGWHVPPMLNGQPWKNYLISMDIIMTEPKLVTKLQKH